MKLMFDTDSISDILCENVINEETGAGKKQYKIKGVFSTIGEKNRNGRIYPSKIWENEIASYQTNFSNGSINTLMEYKHPPRTEVEPMEAVAKITSLKIDGKYVIGEAVLLDNEKANQLKTLIDNGIKVSVSSRGVGSVKGEVVENFKLITYDIVPVPSDYNATMNGVVENYQLNEGIVTDLSFEVNESGSIIVADVSDDYSKEDLQDGIREKFKKLLNNF